MQIQFDKQISAIVQNSHHYQEKFFCSMRFLKKYSPSLPKPNDSYAKNFVRITKNFFTKELKKIPIKIVYQENVSNYTTDAEGWLHLELPCKQTPLKLDVVLPHEDVQNSLEISPISFDNYKATVISDLDDTVIQSGADKPMKMYKEVAVSNSYTREAMPGMAKLYEHLTSQNCGFVYLSKSPVNLYEQILSFLKINKFPQGLIFLRQFGVTEVCDAPFEKKNFKIKTLQNCKHLWKDKKVLFFGDDNEHDEQVYRQISEELSLESQIWIKTADVKKILLSDKTVKYFDNPDEIKKAIDTFLSA